MRCQTALSNPMKRLVSVVVFGVVVSPLGLQQPSRVNSLRCQTFRSAAVSAREGPREVSNLLEI